MPAWVEIVISASAVVGAIFYLWQKLLKPGAQIVAALDYLLPVMKELVEDFHDNPEALATLREIAQQFRTNSGTSLRDVIDRLEQQISELHAYQIEKPTGES